MYCEDQWKYLSKQCFNDVEGQTDPYEWTQECDDMVKWMKENWADSEDDLMVLKSKYQNKPARKSVKATKKQTKAMALA